MTHRDSEDWYPDRGTAVIAKFLGDSQLPYCSRATLRALLPTGTTRGESRLERKIKPLSKSGHNRVSAGFQDALRELEDRRFIERGTTFVKVVNHQGLREYAARRHSLNESWMDHVAHAVARVRKEIAAERLPKIVEMRQAELKALERLMIDARGANWSGRGSVRFVPHSQAM